MPIDSLDTVFVGNSLTDNFPVECFHSPHVKNRGINGNCSYDILKRIKDIAKGNPKQIYFMDGINDIIQGINPDSSFSNYRKIFAAFNPKKTKIIIESVLPDSNPAHVQVIKKYNEHFAQMPYTFINLYPLFKTSEGLLNPKLTIDGLHLNVSGIKIWKQAL